MNRPRIRTKNGIKIYTEKTVSGKNITTYEYTKNIDGLKTLNGEYETVDFNTGMLVETGKYRNGNRTGVRKIYKEGKNGEPYLYSEINYRGGKRSGVSVGNYENGSIRYIMNFTGNKIVGTSVSFSNDGKLIMTLSTTVTNKTTVVTKRVGLVKNKFSVVNGEDNYKEFMKTVKSYFDDGTN